MLKGLFEAIFYEADIFKVPFVLLFQNRKKSSTVLGSLFSISIVTIVLYLFTTSNMLLKTNPLVIDQTTTNSHASLIELNPQNFEVAAGVANSFGKGFSDPTIFKVQFIQIEIDYNETVNSKQITNLTIKKNKPCTADHFSHPSTFSTLGLNNYACLENGTFQIEGGFDEKSLKAVVVMISYCNNKTDGVVCKTQADINTFFKDKGLWLYYQDDIYDVSNYMEPISKNWRLQAIQCAAVSRIIDLYIKKLIFINDDQFIFTNERFDYGFMKERSEGLSDYVMVDSPLISINLFSSKNNQRTKRQYQKFGDLLASIGGIINVLIILGFIFTNLENQLQMQNHIMNTLYSYSYEQKEKMPKLKGKNKSAGPSRLHSAQSKIEHHLWDWNKEYEEMASKEMITAGLREKPHAKTDRDPRDRDRDDDHDEKSYRDEDDLYKDVVSPGVNSARFNSKLRSNDIELMSPLPISREPTYKGIESKVFDYKDIKRTDTRGLITSLNTENKGLQCDSKGLTADTKVVIITDPKVPVTDSKVVITDPKAMVSDSKETDSKRIDLRRNKTQDARQIDLKKEHNDAKIFAKGIIKKQKSLRENTAKSHFVVTKIDMPNMLIESAKKFSSPTHQRIMSPELRPKEFSLAASETHNEIKNDDRHFKDADDTQKVTMKISEYIKMQAKVMFKKKLSEKERLFILSEKKFLKETDICYILEKIQEFEKFKLILLNPDQLQLFNLLAKPLIYLESQREEFRRKSSYMIARSLEGDTTARNDAKKRIAELKKHYQKMTGEKHLSFIDRNLLQLIEDDIFTK